MMPIKRISPYKRRLRNATLVEDARRGVRRVWSDLLAAVRRTWPVDSGTSASAWELAETRAAGATGREQVGYTVRNRTAYAGWVFRRGQRGRAPITYTQHYDAIKRLDPDLTAEIDRAAVDTLNARILSAFDD